MNDTLGLMGRDRKVFCRILKQFVVVSIVAGNPLDEQLHATKIRPSYSNARAIFQ